jgi:pimeloyl-ACP methyl ester carboxylesterase
MALAMIDELDGLPVFRHEREGERVLYVHGVPNDADEWLPFLERTGGVAVDLPGFGRSGKPAHFPYSIEGYDRFTEQLLDALGWERASLVMHDWGTAALAFAQRRSERIDKLVVMNAVPLLPGYRWHRVARLWRRPLVGELTMGFTTKWALKRGLRREAFAEPQNLTDEAMNTLWERFDHGTQRAILKLYRASPEPVLEAAGRRLGEIGAESLVVWGDDDPYLPLEFGEAYAKALGGRLIAVEGARHWPWLDRPAVIDDVVAFLETH